MSFVILKPNSYLMRNRFSLKFSIFASFFLATMSCFSVFASSLLGFGLDTIAGESTVLRSTMVENNSNFIFDVRDPLGQVESYDVKSGDNGLAVFNLNGENLTRSGEYLVALRSSNEQISFEKSNSFTVFPAEISKNNSIVYPKNQVVSNGTIAKVNVSAFDQFYNPIANKKLNLSDGNKNFSANTNSDGVATFSVSGEDVLSLNLYDDLGNLIDSDVNVLFKKSIGAGGIVSSFNFTEVPNEIVAGESFDLTVEAIDQDENIVTDYTGEIRFFIEGENEQYAVLPQDYEFDLSDQGEHKFNLSFRFQQPGEYLLKVADLSNPEVEGEVLIDILTGETNVSTEGFEILSPSDGVYGSGNFTVSGVAPAGSEVKLYDNDIELDYSIVGLDSQFNFDVNLPNGNHSIYAALLNADGIIIAVSNLVAITVDNSSAEISSVTISPDEILPASPVTVRLITDSNLSRAYMLVGGNQYDMSKTSSGNYEGAFAAPISFGDYFITFVLEDELGNESRFDDFKGFTVGRDLSLPPPQKVNLRDLPTVSGLSAEAKNKRVVLDWTSVDDENVTKYRVYYGVSPAELTEAIDTITSESSWYVPNLINGETYYFAVVALDQFAIQVRSIVIS